MYFSIKISFAFDTDAKKRHIRTQLKVAVETQNPKTLPKAVQDFKDAKLSDDDGDLEKAERLLKMLKCSKGDGFSLSTALLNCMLLCCHSY